MAASVFRHLAKQAGRAGDFVVESAGLGQWHVGEAPDERAQAVGRAHGVDVTGAAQQFQSIDFDSFDLVLALDTDIYRGLERLAPNAAARAKIRFLRDFDPQASHSRDVPDPYYGSTRHFEQVFELVERSSQGLLAALSQNGQTSARQA